MKVYRCKSCNLTVRKEEGLRSHLHWHKITDKEVSKYFTEEEEAAEAPPAAQAAPAKQGGLLRWLRRG
jgi:hypothetical protein